MNNNNNQFTSTIYSVLYDLPSSLLLKGAFIAARFQLANKLQGEGCKDSSREYWLADLNPACDIFKLYLDQGLTSAADTTASQKYFETKKMNNNFLCLDNAYLHIFFVC